MRMIAKVVIALLLTSQLGFGRILHVPEEFTTIQSAIDSAAVQDTIVLSSGEYLESVRIPSRGLTIGSTFVLSGDTSAIGLCNWRGRASLGDSVRCILLEDSGTVTETRVAGIRFTQSATHYADSGGAILVHGQNLELRNCIFDTCSAGFGGAVAATDATVKIQNCRFMYCGQFRTAAIFGIVRGWAKFDSCIFANSVSYEQIDEIPTQFRLTIGTLGIYNSIFSGIGFGHYPAGSQFVGVWQQPAYVSIVGCSFNNNRISPLVAYGGEQVDTLRIDSNLFSDNGLAGRLYTQDAFDSGTVFQAIGNTFERFTPVPGYVLSGPFGLDTSQQNVTILERNLIQEMDSGNVAFCSVYDDHPGYRSIRHNYIFNNSTWSWTWPPGGMVVTIRTGAGELEQNIFLNNRGYSIFQGPINVLSFARHNYYGHETGPYDSHANPGGLGDSIDWRVVYIPWATDTNFVDVVSEPREPVEVPQSFIGNAYPNPFNSNVTIEFVLLNDQVITLEIFDLMGRHVQTILSGRMNKGVHIRDWHPESQASGIYFARLVGEKNLNSTVKLLLLK